MRYATKYRMVNVALPVLVMASFGLVGAQTTHHMFAQALPTPTLGLTVSKSEYRVGETVIATLSNTSAEDAYVINNCPNEPLNVSRLTSAGWEPVQNAAPVAKCAGEPRDYEIPANRSIRVSYGSWPMLFDDPGTYRIHAAIEPGQDGPTVEFKVVP